MEDKIGNFKIGKCFDALVVDPFSKDSPFDVTEFDHPLDVFQKFLLLGDDRSFNAVYVNGVKVLQN